MTPVCVSSEEPKRRRISSTGDSGADGYSALPWYVSSSALRAQKTRGTGQKER